MSTVGRLSKLVDRKVIPMPNKATIVRLDQITVDLQISAGSGTIHHVAVQGDISQLTPGMIVPIQWTERDGGYLAPVVIATGNAVVSGLVPSVIVDNQTLQSVDGELQVRPGGIETRHLAFVPSVDGHSHNSDLSLAGLQTREGILENVAGDFAIRGDGTIEVGGDLHISGTDPTYRFWVGDPDPALAPFSIEADGTVHGVAGGSITVEEADGAPSVGGVTKIKVPNGTLTDNGGGTVTVAAATDDDAIHDNASGEISALTEKTSPVGDDLVLIEDSAASNAKKKVKLTYIMAPPIAKDLTYWVGPAGNDNNDGSYGYPFLTIGKAVSKFHGKSVINCDINIGAGTYAEEVNLSGFHSDMFSGLRLLGQSSNNDLNGLAFIHGDSTGTYISDAYEGSGTITLSTDNSGTGGRIRIITTRATTNPFFQGYISTGSKVWVWNGSTLTEYGIYGISTNAITLASTAAAPALNVNGRYFVVAPDVIIDAPNTAESYSVEVFNMGVRIEGIHLRGYYGGVRLYSASVMTSECLYTQEYTGSWYGTVHLAGPSYFFARYDPLNDAPISIIGHWAGVVNGYGSVANLGGAMIHGKGTYGAYVAGGSGYYNGTRFPVGTYSGIYSASGGYAYAANTSARNWASTPYSPSTNNAFGNNNGSITF